MATENEALVEYRLKSLEDKFDKFIIDTRASMKSMEEKIDRLPDGMIGRREFEEYRKIQGERNAGFVGKEEHDSLKKEVRSHNTIFIFVASGIGAALIAAFMALILKGPT